MAKVYDGIHPDMAAWIQHQPVFFVWRTRDDESGSRPTTPRRTRRAWRPPGLSGSSESAAAREDPVAPAGRR